MWLLTKRRSSMNHHRHYVLWWSSQMEVTSTKRYWISRSVGRHSQKQKYGRYSAIWSADSRLCTIKASCTEISNVQTSSLIETVKLKWETLTCLKLLSMGVYCSRKLVHHTMQVPKFGRINLTITKVISGRLVAWSTKWHACNHHSELLTWTLCTRRS